MALWLQNEVNENCFILNMKKYQRSSRNCFRIDRGWLCISNAEKPNHLYYKEPAGKLRVGYFKSAQCSAAAEDRPAACEALWDFSYDPGMQGQNSWRGKKLFKELI